MMIQTVVEMVGEVEEINRGTNNGGDTWIEPLVATRDRIGNGAAWWKR